MEAPRNPQQPASVASAVHAEPESAGLIAGFDVPFADDAPKAKQAKAAVRAPKQESRDRGQSLTKVPSKYRKFAKGN